MAGRNNRAIADALQALAQAIGNPNWGEAGGAVEYQGLDHFQRNNPPSFNGGYNPDGAQNWIREIEKKNLSYGMSGGAKGCFWYIYSSGIS